MHERKYSAAVAFGENAFRGAFTAGADPANLATGSVVVELPPDSPSMKAQPLANVAGAEASENVSLVYVFLETVDPNNGSAKFK